MTQNFWAGKRVLLTGHTGFKGAWLALWLHQLGAHVVGIALPPQSQPNLFSLADIGAITESHFCDLRDPAALAAIVRQSKPEVVFHLAAQALVRPSYKDPIGTFATNTLGTAHLLDALRDLDSVRATVAVTTDKVYRNKEHCYPYREADELGGHDPYSASKAAAELVIDCYRDAFLKEQGVALASARAGNVIGGGDWSEDRLIPDAIRAWSSGQILDIRRPDAIRPWQHVLEPLAGYMALAERLWEKPELAGAYNFGPASHSAATVREVISLARATFGQGETAWGDGSAGPHEAGWLALENARARHLLNVSPRWDLDESVARSIAWYRDQAAGKDARALCLADIAAFNASRPL